jgi:hypothetical protein
VTLAVGVALFGTLTGFLANAFLRPNARLEQQAVDRTERLQAELADIREQLTVINEHAETMANSPSSTPAATRAPGPGAR